MRGGGTERRGVRGTWTMRTPWLPAPHPCTEHRAAVCPNLPGASNLCGCDLELWGGTTKPLSPSVISTTFGGGWRSALFGHRGHSRVVTHSQGSGGEWWE